MSTSEHQLDHQPIEDAVDLNDKDEFWRAVHEEFARLRSDSVDLWDSAAGHGLHEADQQIPPRLSESVS